MDCERLPARVRTQNSSLLGAHWGLRLRYPAEVLILGLLYSLDRGHRFNAPQVLRLAVPLRMPYLPNSVVMVHTTADSLQPSLIEKFATKSTSETQWPRPGGECGWEQNVLLTST